MLHLWRWRYRSSSGSRSPLRTRAGSRDVRPPLFLPVQVDFIATRVKHHLGDRARRIRDKRDRIILLLEQKRRRRRGRELALLRLAILLHHELVTFTANREGRVGIQFI